MLTEFLKNTLDLIKANIFKFILLALFLPGITEMKTLDLRVKLRGEISADPRILLIDIDDQSQSLRPPWDLEQLENLLVPILQSQPAVLGLDLRFYDRPVNYVGDLSAFIERIASYSVPIVLAAGLRDDQIVTPELARVPHNVSFGSVTLIDNYYPESDNVVRRVRLFTRAQGEAQPVPAFALQILAAARNIEPLQCHAELVQAGVLEPAQAYPLIRYSNNYRYAHPDLNRFEKFRAISAHKIIDPADSTYLSTALSQRIGDSTLVLVGATFQSQGSEDWFQTPLSHDRTISGVVVHANILSWLLARRAIPEPGFWRYLLLILFLLAGSGIALRFYHPNLKIKKRKASRWKRISGQFLIRNKALLLLLGLFLIYGALTLVVFLFWELWLPLVWPLRIASVGFLTSSTLKYQIFKTEVKKG